MSHLSHIRVENCPVTASELNELAMTYVKTDTYLV
jgi:hypothetical protein